MEVGVLVEPGEREDGNVYHVNDGWQYHINTTINGRIYYQCVRKRTHGCWGRASSDVFGQDFHHTSAHIGHQQDFLYPSELRCRRSILRVAASGTWTCPSALVREQGRLFPVEVAARLHLARLRSSIYRVRLKHYPPIPNDLQEMGLFLEDPRFRNICATLDGEDNIFAGAFGDFHNGTKCLIFISDRMKNYMRDIKTVFSDGTFKTRTRHPNSMQIFNIVTIRRFHVIPLVRVIMQRRTRAAYEVVLRALAQLVPGFRPRTVMTDYEGAMQNAWEAVFHVRTKGCLYHFAVAVLKKARRLGLTDFLLENYRASSIVRSLCALPLLPQHLIYRGLFVLGEEALHRNVLRQLQPLFQYMEDTWIVRLNLRSVEGCIHRTNNACESDNRGLSKEVGLPYPNVWHLLGAFVRSEDSAVTDLHTLAMGGTPSRRRKSTALANDRRIQNFTSDLRLGEIGIREFLHCASRSLQGVFDDQIYQNNGEDEEQEDEEGL